MDETQILNQMLREFELLHVASNRVFHLPSGKGVFRIGKANDSLVPEIDVSNLDNQEIVSRQHALIRVQGGNYYVVDNGSANGTYLNGEKLTPIDSYQLKPGDRISLGMGEKVVFIFQAKTPLGVNPSPQTSQTVLQTRNMGGALQKSHPGGTGNRTSKITGLTLIAIAIVLIASNTQIGIFVRIPGLILCAAGAILQFQHRINKNIGWVLIVVGILIILTGNVFASVNLLAVIMAAGLLFAGYQLITRGKILNYSLNDIRDRAQRLLRGKGR